MPTPTARLGLLKPSTSDAFSTADIAANWQKIDDNPGIFLCTSTTRPAWGAAHKGREIMETDTLLKWIWTGSVAAGGFVRSAPGGLLKTTTGAWATAQRTTSISTTSTSAYVVALTLANVVVPAGQRSLMITATYPRATNSSSGMTAIGIYRTATANGTPRIGSWYVGGDGTSPVAGAGGSGGSYVTFEKGGLAAGVYTYTLQFRVNGSGTSALSCDATTPLELSVIEI